MELIIFSTALGLLILFCCTVGNFTFRKLARSAHERYWRSLTGRSREFELQRGIPACDSLPYFSEAALEILVIIPKREPNLSMVGKCCSGPRGSEPK